MVLARKREAKGTKREEILRSSPNTIFFFFISFFARHMHRTIFLNIIYFKCRGRHSIFVCERVRNKFQSWKVLLLYCSKEKFHTLYSRKILNPPLNLIPILDIPLKSINGWTSGTVNYPRRDTSDRYIYIYISDNVLHFTYVNVGHSFLQILSRVSVNETFTELPTRSLLLINFVSRRRILEHILLLDRTSMLRISYPLFRSISWKIWNRRSSD